MYRGSYTYNDATVNWPDAKPCRWFSRRYLIANLSYGIGDSIFELLAVHALVRSIAGVPLSEGSAASPDSDVMKKLTAKLSELVGEDAANAFASSYNNPAQVGPSPGWHVHYLKPIGCSV